MICEIEPAMMIIIRWRYNTFMSQQNAHGIVTHTHSSRPTDYLYRISIKCLIRDDQGKILVVKEAGRNWWDLPGGGMDHGESIQSAIAREMKEEVNLSGEFTYRTIDVDEPAYLEAHNFWQLRLIFEVYPKNLEFSVGQDADEIAVVDPIVFENSEIETERRIFRYAALNDTRH